MPTVKCLQVKYWEGWEWFFFFPFCIVCFGCYSTEKYPIFGLKIHLTKKLIVLSTDHLFWKSDSWYLDSQGL